MSTNEAGEPIKPAGQSILWALVSTIAVALWLGLGAGWIWALAGVVGLFVHEYGHYLAINRAGCGPSRIYLVPFLGGMALQPKPAESEMVEVSIALAGPAVGILATLPFFGLYAFDKDPIWLEGAAFIAGINLLNLFPAPPLDGSKALGPVLALVHPMLERAVAIALAGVAILWLFSRGGYVVGALIAFTMLPVLMGKPTRAAAEPLTGREAGHALLLYTGVAAMCALPLVVIGVALKLDNPLSVLVGLVR